ncbi:MAG: type II secretory pathway protein, partial [Sphingomonas sp.]
MHRADRSSETGAALLTVLLLVAVIAVLAGTALEKLRLSTRLGSNAVAMDQARAYSFAAETLALTKVSDLLKANGTRVTLAGGWSGRPIPLPVPGGVATARLTDGGNCFNLNSLVVETAPNTYAAYTPARLQFARLIRLVGGPGASG